MTPFFHRGKRDFDRELIEIFSHLASQRTLDGLSKAICAAVARMVQAPSVDLFFCDDTLQSIYPPTKAGLLPQPLNVDHPGPFLEELQRRGIILFRKDVFTPVDFELRAAELFIPLQIADKLVGFLSIGGRRLGSTYGPEEIEFLELFRSSASTALLSLIEAQNILEMEKLDQLAKDETQTALAALAKASREKRLERRDNVRVPRNMLLAVVHDSRHSAAPISTCDVSDRGFCVETKRIWNMELPIFFRVLGPIANGVSGIAALRWKKATSFGRLIYGAEIATMSPADRAVWAPVLH